MYIKRILLPCLTLALTLSACTGLTSKSTSSTPNTSGKDPISLEPTLEPEAVGALPAGGEDVLGPDTFAAFERGSSEAVKIETFAVTGRSFTQARRIIGLKPLEQPWSEQLSANNVVAIAKDDALVVQFWARSASSAPAQTEFVFELNNPYVPAVQVGVSLTPQWKLYSAPFRAEQDYAVGRVGARFRLGYAGQSFELGGVIVKNYGKKLELSALPITGFSYPGREAKAVWRTAANARIEQLRKTDVSVKVLDSSGQPLAGATVKLEMQRHAFPFGSEVNVERLFENSADGKKYQDIIPTLFNEVVLGNALKWPDWEGFEGEPQGQRRGLALKALKLFKSKNIPVRGHNLVWPCDNDYCLPRDVPALLAAPDQLRARIDQHFQDILGATKGQIVEWDVINEPSGNKRLSKVLGEDEMAAQLKRARELEPDARMVINDANNLGEGNSDAEFKRILRRMLELGAPLEGIGLQGHFSFKLTPPEELYGRLEDFGALNLPLSITEFDVNIPDEKLQADYLRDFLTVAFSSNYVSKFLMWGFWEGQHWLPQTALYRRDWSLKPNGKAFKDLLFKTWWTNISGSSDASGQYKARGFLGEYKLTVTANGKTTVKSLKLEKGMAEVVITL